MKRKIKEKIQKRFLAIALISHTRLAYNFQWVKMRDAIGKLKGKALLKKRINIRGIEYEIIPEKGRMDQNRRDWQLLSAMEFFPVSQYWAFLDWKEIPFQSFYFPISVERGKSTLEKRRTGNRVFSSRTFHHPRFCFISLSPSLLLRYFGDPY